MRQAAHYDLHTTEGLAQVQHLRFILPSGEVDTQFNGMTIRGGVLDDGIREMPGSEIINGRCALQLPRLAAGCHRYDVLVSGDGTDKPLLAGVIHVEPRVTPVDLDDNAPADYIDIVIPADEGGTITVISESPVWVDDAVERSLQERGMFVEPVNGETVLSMSAGTNTRDFNFFTFAVNSTYISGHLSTSYKLNKIALRTPAAQNNGTRWRARLYKITSAATMQTVALGESTSTASWVSINASTAECSWSFSAIPIAASDRLVLEVYAVDASGAATSNAFIAYGAPAAQGSTEGVLIKTEGSYIWRNYSRLMMTFEVAYTDGVSVGGIELASRRHFDALAADVKETGMQVANDAQSSEKYKDAAATAKEQAEEALRLANAAAAAAQAALAAIPQVDASGNMTLAGGVTASAGTINGPLVINNPAGNLADGTHNQIFGVTWYYQQGEFRNGLIVRNGLWVESGTISINANASMRVSGPSSFVQAINANGGVNIPPSVSPLLTGAVSNSELLDYLVDRTMRMSPYVTTVPAIILKDYIDSDKSTISPYVNLGMGMIGIKSWGVGINTERRIRFKNDKSPFYADTQDGPMFYNGSVVIYSSPTLLSVSYLTSPGAMAQIGFFGNNGRQFGVRLINKDGTAYYEMFYRTGEQDDEVVAVSEIKPDYANLYSGSIQPKYKMQSLAIYCPSNQGNYAIVKFGPWTMRVPYYIDPSFVLDLLVRDGTKSISYYGAGLSARIATITYICLGYTDQFVPDLNNNTYKS